MIDKEFNYQKYTAKPDSLTFEKALNIYNDIYKQFDIDDEMFADLMQNIVVSASNYVKMRNNWTLFTTEEKLEKDDLRTNYHNAFIIDLKTLMRYMERLGHNTKWFNDLTLGKDAKLRKRIGDFAGYFLLFNTLKAR